MFPSAALMALSKVLDDQALSKLIPPLYLAGTSKHIAVPSGGIVPTRCFDGATRPLKGSISFHSRISFHALIGLLSPK